MEQNKAQQQANISADISEEDEKQQHESDCSTLYKEAFSSVYKEGVLDQQQYLNKKFTECRINSSGQKCEDILLVYYFNHKFLQSAQVLIKLDHFEFYPKIAKINQLSPHTDQQSSAEGTYGILYTFPFFDSEITIKSFPIQYQQKLFDILMKIKVQQIIKQYVIAKMSSQLKCGPAMTRPFGFDIVIFNNRIQFAMENCQNISKFEEEDEGKLLENMALLHSYKIMHMDISTNNIMYSPTFQKPVFIDYGFSQIIGEEQGSKTYTKFKGTPEYISRQMLFLFSIEEKKGFVDLYYNDLVGVKRVIADLKKEFLEGFSLKRQIQNMYFDENKLFKKFNFENLDKEDFIQKSAESRQAIYLLFVFYFSVFYPSNKRLEEIVRVKNGIILKYQTQNLIKIAKLALPSVEIENFIIQQLNSLKKIDQIKQLLKTIQHRRMFSFFNKISQFLPSASDFFPDFCKQKISIMKEQNKCVFQEERVNNFTNRQFLEACSDNIDVFLSYTFDNLRFDTARVNRANFEEKKKIAKLLFDLFQIQHQQSSERFGQIQNAYKYLFQYCFQTWESQLNSKALQNYQSRNTWCLMMIQLLITQALIIDMDVIGEIQQFCNIFFSQKLDFYQEFYLFYFFFNAVRYYQIRYVFSDMQLGKRTQKQLKNSLQRLEIYIINKYQKSSENKYKFTALVLSEKEHFFQHYFQKDVLQQFQIISEDDLLLKKSVKNILFHEAIQIAKEYYSEDFYQHAIACAKEHFSSGYYLQFRSFAEKIYWLSVLMNNEYAEHYQFESIIYKEIPLSEFNQKESFNNISLIFSQQLINLIRGNENKFIEVGKHFLAACFQHEELELHQQKIKIFLFYFTTSGIKVSQAKINFVFEFTERYLVFLENELDNYLNSLQRKVKVKKRKRLAAILLLLQFYQVILFLNSKELQSKLLSILDKIYWRSLSVYSLQQKMTLEQRIIHHFYFNISNRQTQQIVQLEKLNDFFSKAKLQLSLKPSLEQQFAYNVIKMLRLRTFSKIEDSQIYGQTIFDMFKPVIYKIFLQLRKYCSFHQLFKFYFFKSNIYVTMNILLLGDQQYPRICLFLYDISEFLGNYPWTVRIHPFNSSILQFAKNEPQFFRMENIFLYFKNLAWKHRFLYVLYAFSLNYEDKLQNKFKLYLIIIDNIDILNWYSKCFILFICYCNILEFKFYKKFHIEKLRKKKRVLFDQLRYRNNILGFEIDCVRKNNKRFLSFFKFKKTAACPFKKQLKKKMKKFEYF